MLTFPWTTTSRSIYTDESYTVRLYETGVADQAVLIHGIVASGQCLPAGTKPVPAPVPASTVLTNTIDQVHHHFYLISYLSFTMKYSILCLTAFAAALRRSRT